MKDLPAILAAHARLRAAGEESLIVTLVHTEGSTYRRPGARMLVLPGCQTLGTISGGCLEPQVARDAFAATRNSPRVLLTVENSPDDDAWGPSSGCHGRLSLLAERIAPNDSHPALEALQTVRTTHRPELLAHFFARNADGALTPTDAPADPRWQTELDTTRANAAWNRRVSTATLNRFLEEALQRHATPAISGRRVRIRYMTQAKARPPSFALFGNQLDALPEAYLRYLQNGLREAFDLKGTPLRFITRNSRNPYDPKR